MVTLRRNAAKVRAEDTKIVDPEVLAFAQVMGVLVPSIVALVGVGLFAYRFIQRSHLKPAAPPRMADDRLDRLEHAIDAIAIEVERISESQRFMARLTAERSADPPTASLLEPPRDANR